MKGTGDRVKATALAAGVAAICVSGVAGAVQLVSGSDIRNHSLQYKDLSKRAKAKLRAGVPRTSLLVASFFPADGTPSGAVNFTAPGGGSTRDGEGDSQLQVPPGAGFRVRGLRARSLDTGGGGAASSQTFTLRLNGDDTSLSCVANVANSGLCGDQGTIVARPGDRLSIKTVNTASAPDFMHAIVTLSIESR